MKNLFIQLVNQQLVSIRKIFFTFKIVVHTIVRLQQTKLCMQLSDYSKLNLPMTDTFY